MKKSLLLLLLPTLMFLGCEKEKTTSITEDISLEVRHGKGKAVERAFRGLLISPPITPKGPCELGPEEPGILFGEDIDGNLTHLGKTVGSYTACGRPYFPGVPESIPGRFLIDFTLTGAQGDQLNIAVELFSFPDENNPALSQSEGTYSITGGSGRFADAFGEGKASAIGAATPLDPQIDIPLTLEGSIVY